MSMKDEINFPIVSYPFVCISIPVKPPYGNFNQKINQSINQSINHDSLFKQIDHT
jgi:hypothetical protein